MSDPASNNTQRERLARLGGLLGPLMALAVVFCSFAVADFIFADGTFASFRNIRTVTVQTCVVAVAALGMTVVIIAGGIDLSAGTALALCATTLAWGLREDVATVIAHGDNYAGASRKMEQAWDDWEAAEAQSRPSIRPRIDTHRTRLQRIIDGKLARLRALTSTSDRQQVIKQLQQRRDQLDDLQFRVHVNQRWLDGVPNAAWSAPLAVMIGIATGIACGIANGLVTSYLRLPPFIVTLGSMSIFLGLANALSGNVPIRPKIRDQVPHWLGSIVSNSNDALWLGFPTGVWLALLSAMGLAVILRYSVFGRYVFAIGSNESAARLCGIHVRRWKVAVYALAGLFVGVAGVFQFSRLSTGNPQSGLGLELLIIAAVVIGGGSLTGGRGTVLGTLTGAAISAVIASGCTQLGMENTAQRIILGAIIIAAVALDQWRERRL